MKKYTVIYGDFFTSGSHTSSITKMQYIECVKENLIKTIEESGIEMSQVWFILEGHCEKTKD